MSMILRKKPLSDREEQVLKLHREEGISYSRIAKLFGISAGRVRQMCEEAVARLREHEEAPGESLALLPGRARKVLENLEFHSRSEVRAAIESGRLWCDANWWNLSWAEQKQLELGKEGVNFGRLRNVGWKTWRVICEWLELPLPEPPSSLKVQCPHCGGSFLLREEEEKER